MKRTSVVAPLLLIGIGVLFLARNLYPDLPLIDYLARYWPSPADPVGRAAASRNAVLGGTDKPLPARGVSGGEWVLVVLLCIFGASLHAFRGSETWWPRSDSPSAAWTCSAKATSFRSPPKSRLRRLRT